MIGYTHKNLPAYRSLGGKSQRENLPASNQTGRETLRELPKSENPPPPSGLGDSVNSSAELLAETRATHSLGGSCH